MKKVFAAGAYGSRPVHFIAGLWEIGGQKLGRTLAACALVALFAGLCFGQDYRARVQGTVTDATQASIAGATVTLKNVATGVTTVQQSTLWSQARTC